MKKQKQKTHWHQVVQRLHDLGLASSEPFQLENDIMVTLWS